MDRKALLGYWQNPGDGKNTIGDFLSVRCWRRSCLLAEVIENLIPKESSIVELGSGTGRNLFLLWVLGYRDLTGVDVSKLFAVEMCKKFPMLQQYLYLDSVEDYLREGRKPDLIYTMAFLEHLHPDSEWVFDKVKSRWLITIEDELRVSERHFPRNYERVFREYKQITTIKLGELFPWGFKGRIFKRRDV